MSFHYTYQNCLLHNRIPLVKILPLTKHSISNSVIYAAHLSWHELFYRHIRKHSNMHCSLWHQRLPTIYVINLYHVMTYPMSIYGSSVHYRPILWHELPYEHITKFQDTTGWFCVTHKLVGFVIRILQSTYTVSWTILCTYKRVYGYIRTTGQFHVMQELVRVAAHAFIMDYRVIDNARLLANVGLAQACPSYSHTTVVLSHVRIHQKSMLICVRMCKNATTVQNWSSYLWWD